MVNLPKPKMEGYVIYNPALDAFSTGGMHFSSTDGIYTIFKKHGKIWSSIGAVKNHLNQYIDTKWNFDNPNETVHTVRIYGVYKDCEIYNIHTNEKLNWTPMGFLISKAEDWIKNGRRGYGKHSHFEIVNR